VARIVSVPSLHRRRRWWTVIAGVAGVVVSTGGNLTPASGHTGQSEPLTVHHSLHHTHSQVTATVIDPRRNIVYAIEPIGLVAVLHVHADRLRTVVVGNQPAALAVNKDSGAVYVTNTASHDVTEVKGDHVRHTIRLHRHDRPTDVLVDQHTHDVYVTDTGRHRVSVIHGHHVVRTLRVGHAPTGVTEVGHRIYVANSGSGSLSILRGTTVKRRDVPIGGTPTVLGANAKTGHVFVLDPVASTVTTVTGHHVFAVATLTPGATPAAILVSKKTDTEDVLEDGTDTPTGPNTLSGLAILRDATLSEQIVGRRSAPDGISLDPHTGDVAVGTVLGHHGFVLHGIDVVATGHLRFQGAFVGDPHHDRFWAGTGFSSGTPGIVAARLK
jgi:DNA-binding beta-propeller fold protein YncE